MAASVSMTRKRVFRLVVVAIAVFCTFSCLLAVPPIGRLLHPIKLQLLGRDTVEQRVQQYGAQARDRLLPVFERAGVLYPPASVTLVGLKQERELEVYAADPQSAMRFVTSYPILGASGGLGPKLMEGDRQVPEGLYGVEGLNPNSRFHLSIKVDYPNGFDRAMAEADGRTNLGGNIFIHGGSASVGCLAMGDEAVEDLFVLLAETGVDKVNIIVAPLDTRGSKSPDALLDHAWQEQLYEDIRGKLESLPKR